MTKRILLILIIAGFALPGFSQDRIAELSRKLDDLSENLIPGLKDTTSYSVSDVPIQQMIRAVAEAHDLNVEIAPNVDVRVTNNFRKVSVKDMLMFLVDSYELDIIFYRNILKIVKYNAPVVKQPKAKRDLSISYDNIKKAVSVDLRRDTLFYVLKEITRVSGVNFIAAPDLENYQVSGYLKDLGPVEMVSTIARANKLEFERQEEGVYKVFKKDELPANNTRNNNTGRGNTRNNRLNQQSQLQSALSVKLVSKGIDSLIQVEAVDASIKELIVEAGKTTNQKFVLYDNLDGNSTCFFNSISFHDLVSYLLYGTEFSFVKDGDSYIIGSRQNEDLRVTQLIRLQNRTVQDFLTFIPNSLTTDLEINVLEELNGLIVNGHENQVKKLEKFISTLDVLVPNVLIEVIVVEARKGFTLNTGIQAFLSDTVPATRGTVFPGTDVTISSSSVNNVLNKLGNNSFINLGRVTPNFYVRLQAEENNNNLKIRSTPKLSTLSGHEANLVIGESSYYVIQTQNVTPGVNPIVTTSQEFNAVDANLRINIKPLVSGDEHITLEISAEFSDFIEPAIQGAPPGNSTRQFVSLVRMRNSEMIVLGGLEEESKTESNTGTPFLSRIPVLKWIFSSKSQTKSDSRLLVFIKPTIVY